jgi:hypothetical protein
MASRMLSDSGEVNRHGAAWLLLSLLVAAVIVAVTILLAVVFPGNG